MKMCPIQYIDSYPCGRDIDGDMWIGTVVNLEQMWICYMFSSRDIKPYKVEWVADNKFKVHGESLHLISNPKLLKVMNDWMWQAETILLE